MIWRTSSSAPTQRAINAQSLTASAGASAIRPGVDRQPNLGFTPCAIENHDLVARRGQMSRHRSAHDPQTDEKRFSFRIPLHGWRSLIASHPPIELKRTITGEHLAQASDLFPNPPTPMRFEGRADP